jgi:hypothetical protein
MRRRLLRLVFLNPSFYIQNIFRGALEAQLCEYALE